MRAGGRGGVSGRYASSGGFGGGGGGSSGGGGGFAVPGARPAFAPPASGAGPKVGYPAGGSTG